MNAHPVLGAADHRAGHQLAPELPIIRHHHEWYNGSGYPDRLMGDEIPQLARILHVADAFEAMTAASAVPHDAAHRRAGARRAAQVRRRPVRSRGRRRVRPDHVGRRASATRAARSTCDRSGGPIAPCGRVPRAQSRGPEQRRPGRRLGRRAAIAAADRRYVPVLIGGIALGLILGLLAGGRIDEPRRGSGCAGSAVIFLAVVVRYGTEVPARGGIPLAETLRLPLLVTAYAILLLVGAVGQPPPAGPGDRLRRHPARTRSRSWSTAATCRSGSRASSRPGSRRPSRLGRSTVLVPQRRSTRTSSLQSGRSRDIIPIPVPFVRNVASIGDVFLAAGLGFFLFATVVRTPRRHGPRPSSPKPGDGAHVPGSAGRHAFTAVHRGAGDRRRVRPAGRRRLTDAVDPRSVPSSRRVASPASP